ncbi:MAG: single-stranded-DNA-specific exonuclease RecJ [Methyloligellaceae bacterium]
MGLATTIEAGAPGAFLGVRCSARQFRWIERLDPSQSHIATAIAQQSDVPELMGRVLAARGARPETVASFLNPTLKDLMPDPSNLRDMDRAAARLAQAIVDDEPIAVFGDYDVDGAASAALLQRFLAAHDRAARLYIPDRLTEGYGPSVEAFRQLAGEGARLIVAVDCGTSGHAAIEAAAEHGADVVVLDHHQADETLPAAAAIVNPNRLDDLSGQGCLAAAGVVFLVLVATVRALRTAQWYDDRRPEPDLLQWLDLVALATVCDVVPLQGLNRALVAQGLRIMHFRRNIGLRALADVAGLTAEPSPYHLGFVLGPRINAGGRIGSADLGARLLSTGDDAEALEIARTLDHLNNERKALEAHCLESAVALTEQLLEADPDAPLVVVDSGDWHKGLVGLVASRLTDRFRRPSLVVTWAEAGQGTGSARSVAGVDIGAAIRQAVDAGLLVKGGGHAMAAGLTVERDKLAGLTEFLQAALGDSAAAARTQADLAIDGALMAAGATSELMALLERAGPFGSGNPQPRFAFAAHRCRYAKVVGGAHTRCVLTADDGSRIEGIAFRSADTQVGRLLAEGRGHPLHVAGHLQLNRWGGREKVELIIEDVADPREQSI